MGFNYAKEKRKFDAEWVRLRAEYQALGMTEQTIAAIYQFDCRWFNSRRVFETHNQQFPEEGIDQEDETTRSSLINKFDALTTVFDENAFTGRYSWVETIDDFVLAKKLKDLHPDDLELLTLIAMDGFKQAEIANKQKTAQGSISKKYNRLKKKFKKLE